MKFGDILIQNFMGIGEARVILGGRGLVNVEGVNHDDTSALSNGAGKSSFADAVSWCLYGETARGDSGDAVVNEKAGKGTLVDLELLDGAEQWKVIRHRKHKTGKNALHLFHYPAGGGAPVNLTQGTDKLTQAKVDAIVGCSLEVFVGSIYAGQGRMPDLPAMTDKALKVLVEEASGTTLLERGHRIALDDVAGAKGALMAAAAENTRAEDRVRTAMAHVKETDEHRSAWEAGRAGRVAPLVASAKDAAKNAGDWKAIADKHDRAKLEAEIAAADAAIKSVDREKIDLAAFEADVSRTRVASDRAQQEVNRVRRETMALTEKIEELDHKVGCPCHGCARLYTAEDIAPAKAVAAKARDDRAADLPTAQANEDAASEALADAVTARDAFAAGMTDLAATIAARAAASTNLSALTDAERNVKDWTARARDFASRAQAAKAEANPFDAALEDHKRRAEEADKAATVGTMAVVAAEEALQDAQDVAAVFSPAGVRAHVLDTVTPFLNDRTARYLGTLSDGNMQATWTTLTKSAKGELKEKFSIEVAKDLGGRRFSSISGGEKRKVRVACALALQDLVASRATKPIELFIADEVDDALDAAGVERLMTVLTEKARERGSVFVISHSDLKDWIPQTLTIERRGGVSTLTETMA